MNHIPVESSTIVSVGYDKESRRMEVKFKNSGPTMYANVSETLYTELMRAPSKGKFLNARLAYRYEEGIAHSPSRNTRSEPTSETLAVIERTWERIEKQLPERSHEFVKLLLRENPANIVPVKVRLTKHGDFRQRGGGPIHRITVNKSGNPYQFLITLIHEMAHDRAYREYGTEIKPHGPEWRVTFSAFLHRSLAADCFPVDLIPVVRDQAYHPLRSSARAHALQRSLRAYDTLDPRPLVSELQEGAIFSVKRKVIIRKGRSLGHHFHCEDRKGEVFRVAVSARVNAVYREGSGRFVLVKNYEAEASQIRVDSLWDDTYDEKYETSPE